MRKEIANFFIAKYQNIRFEQNWERKVRGSSWSMYERTDCHFGSTFTRVLVVVNSDRGSCKGYNFHSSGNDREANGSTTTGTCWPSMKQLRWSNGAQGISTCTDARFYPIGEDRRQIFGNLPRMYPHTVVNAFRRSYWQEVHDNGP